MIFSIPYDWITIITQNLQKMEWVLPSYTDQTVEQFMARRQGIFDELARVRESGKRDMKHKGRFTKIGKS